MRTKRLAILFAVAAAVLYLPFAFVTLNLNPLEWPEIARAMYSMVWAVILIPMMIMHDVTYNGKPKP